ncbi:hypothetical protein QBC47DRAFT_39846 [Echria macrotheca]|uniref:Uncharacterized protein n=1 Tax=Echria macrotheca TaxID=438768 RepID=A0AAJ0BAF5_9PEZI|nr:hypothetical protein QBC47DRAFT_39846 [Echria macrotheca]
MISRHAWPEEHRKRPREDDYADIAAGGTLGFTEHRSKRLQALPVRTSPNSKRWAEPPNFPPSNPSFTTHPAPRTITPGDSESDSEERIPFQPTAWADEPELSTTVTSLDPDMEMMDTDMNTGVDHSTNPAPQHLEPGPFQPDHVAANIAGRMPTPIHCSFAAQVRGNNWGGAAGSALPGGPLCTSPEDVGNQTADPRQAPAMMGHESVPRSLDGPAAAAQVMADWNMVQNRRLPSPISESGAEEALESPGMVLDSSNLLIGHMDHIAHQHPMLTTLPARSSSAGALGQSSPSPREDTPGAESQGENAMDVESPATPSPRKGHTRSRHTLNSWTSLQPGMKRSFSIGYRADCDKCRMKVPGHFNHIIIS